MASFIDSLKGVFDPLKERVNEWNKDGRLSMMYEGVSEEIRKSGIGNTPGTVSTSDQLAGRAIGGEGGSALTQGVSEAIENSGIMSRPSPKKEEQESTEAEKMIKENDPFKLQQDVFNQLKRT